MRIVRCWVAGVMLALASISPCLAQDDVDAGGTQESGGDPWVGYAGATFLCAFILFLTCRSARRS
jgi:hypothetical protein